MVSGDPFASLIELGDLGGDFMAELSGDRPARR